MNMKHFFLALLLCSQATLMAQQAKIDSIDHFISKALAGYKEIPGLAITIVEDDRAVFTKTYGMADVQQQRPATASTPYYIASVTKTLVGVLAGQLAHEGLFSLDDPLSLIHI